jgi:RimJ/RimL family protein N-acetyltransferase
MLGDAMFLLRLRNDADVRRQFLNTRPINKEDHLSWLNEVLNNPDRVLLVAMNTKKRPIGQIRFDVERGIAKVSVSIVKRYRGKGYGVQLVLNGVDFFQTYFKRRIYWVNAQIRRQNAASIITFRRAGFVSYTGTKECVYLRYSL